MDGVSGLEEGAKSIFKDVVVQRCIVHLIRNSIKYIPSKDYKAFTAQLKRVYGAPSLKAAEAEFERFRQAWSQYYFRTERSEVICAMFCGCRQAVAQSDTAGPVVGAERQ